jgi:hypothetical protein
MLLVLDCVGAKPPNHLGVTEVPSTENMVGYPDAPEGESNTTQVTTSFIAMAVFNVVPGENVKLNVSFAVTAAV